MSDTLRERIAQALRDADGNLSVAQPDDANTNYHQYLADGVLPVVEQAIQQAVERALEEHEAKLCPEDVGCEDFIASLDKRLAEQAQQIANLQEEKLVNGEELDDIAADLFSELCEGDGVHSEELDRALIRNCLNRVARRPVCPHGNEPGKCSWCDLRDDGGLPEARDGR